MVAKEQQIVTTVMAVILDKADGTLLFEDHDEAIGLLTTYRCNLSCKYCYVRIKRNKDMTLEMAQNILEPFLMKHEGMLNIAFMGGETLLAKDVIIPLVEWATSKQWKRRYRFFGSTNGTLLNDTLKIWLKKHNAIFTLGLSYDGIPSTQISNRGANNVDVDFFINTWPKQPIQMTINSQSVKHMAEGIIYLLEKGAVVHPNVAFEEDEWDDQQIAEYGRQLNKLIDYYIEHGNKPLITQFIHNLNEYAYCIDHPVEQHEMCGAGNGFQVFDTDGTSYPCHILSPLVLEGQKLQSIKDGALSNPRDLQDPECNSCPYTSSCPTCIACNFLYRGSFQKRDNTHCQIMRKEVKAFIKKEVLRLKAKEVLTPEDATEIDSIIKLVEFEKSKNK